jgi:hypothetical protein
MQVRIELDNSWNELRQHFPGLPDVDEEIARTVKIVADAYRLPLRDAAFLVAGRLLTQVPGTLEESLEAAEMSQPATGWRDLRRKARWWVRRMMAKGGAAGAGR